MAIRSRSGAHSQPAWLVLTFLAAAILLLTTCSSDDATVDPPLNSGTIGPGGGTVTDAGGASVAIPAGALTENVAIAVKTYRDPATGPFPTGPVPVFWGGAQFGPPGTEFLQPVTITLPTHTALNPGDDYQLFVYDTVNLRWEVEKGAAIVAPGGQTLQAQISHFSLFNGGGFAGGSQARSNITSQLCSFGSAAAVCQAYIAYFQAYVAKVGDKGIYDGECKEVCGLYLDVTCDINGDYAFVPLRDGEFVGEQVSIHDPDDCGEGDGDYGVLEAFATIYYRCTQPDMSATAAPSEIELGGSSTVTTTLTCGDQPLAGQEVQFDRVGFGQLDRHSGATNGAGQAQTTLTNNEQEGQTTVTAYHHACAGQTNAGTVTGEAVVTTGGGWSGTMAVNFDHPIGGSPLDVFSDGVNIDFDLSIDEQGIITGTGTGTHAVDITAGADCWQSSLTAPGFAVAVAGSATEETLNFVVYPNPMMPVSFVITCQHGDDTADYPYPMAEGLIEGSILTQDISISVARQDGATDAGSGSRSEGTDLPMHYSFSVTMHKGGS